MTVNHYSDFYNAEKYAKDYDAIISLGRYMPDDCRQGKKYLYLEFEDVTFNTLNSQDEDAPTAKHIQKLLDFIRSLSPDERLLVHCFAGYSRSPAAVIIAKCERDGMDIASAKENLYNDRIPDKLIPDPNDIMLHQYLMIK